MTKDMFIEQAAGRAEADLRIDNAMVADVFSGEFFPSSVSVGQGRILGFSRLPAREVVDVGGAYLLPGFIDGHVHIESSMLCPARFAELVLPRGTTTVIADPHEIANVRGLDGIRYMLEASRGLPLDVRIMLPSCVPALPVEDAGAVLAAAALAELLDDEKVAGLGEMMNVPGVLSGDPDVLEKIRAARAQGRQVDGHSPGLTGAGLDIYRAAGVGTDHECTTVEELRDRIRRGMYVLLREGSASRDLLRLLPGVTPENSRRCLFCTDDRQPADILERGHMDSHLRIAVAAGLDAMSAIRMATLNAAECYGLRDRGAIAPGLRADLVLVDDLRDFQPLRVWTGGGLTAENGVMKAPLSSLEPGELRHSVNLAPLPERPFELRLPSGSASRKVRVISLLPHSLVTECREREVEVDADGVFELSRNHGMLKIAVLERHHASGKIGVGLLDGSYGLSGGAIATSVAHDSHNIVVAGDDDADMKLAVEELARIGGGVVMASRGKVLDSLPLPIGGLMSEKNAAEVADALRRLLGLAREHYHISEDADAFMTLSFLALPVIPHLKITARGLFDVDAFRFVSVEL